MGAGLQRAAAAARRTRVVAPPEWLLQAAMVAEFNKMEASGWPLTVAGDMNAGKRSFAAAAQAKAMGMKAGEPDVRVYASDRRLFLIEIKTPSGRVSDGQDKRHDRLAALGHHVHVAFLGTEAGARQYARDLAIKHIGAPE